MTRAVILDLDDTLYDERTYVLSGFRAVARDLAANHPDIGADRLYAGMVAELDAHGRGKVFDRALERLGLAVSPSSVQSLVDSYRAHRPDIALWPGVAEALADLRRDFRTAIVTDGLPLMQRRKLDALGVAGLVDEVLVCWEHDAPKPDPECYHEALRRLEATPEDAVVIGDNPQHDMAAARAVGCRAIRVRTGRLAGVADGDFPPDATAADFGEAVQILRRGQIFGAAA